METLKRFMQNFEDYFPVNSQEVSTTDAREVEPLVSSHHKTLSSLTVTRLLTG